MDRQNTARGHGHRTVGHTGTVNSDGGWRIVDREEENNRKMVYHCGRLCLIAIMSISEMSN